MSEAEYDAEIAPLLLAAAKRCEELGYPMVAVVEYEPGERGETRVLPESAGLPMLMLAMVAHHGTNAKKPHHPKAVGRSDQANLIKETRLLAREFHGLVVGRLTPAEGSA